MYFALHFTLLFADAAQSHANKKTKQPAIFSLFLLLDSEYSFGHSILTKRQKEQLEMVTTRVELATLALLAPRSNQLS